MQPLLAFELAHTCATHTPIPPLDSEELASGQPIVYPNGWAGGQSRAPGEFFADLFRLQIFNSDSDSGRGAVSCAWGVLCEPIQRTHVCVISMHVCVISMNVCVISDVLFRYCMQVSCAEELICRHQLVYWECMGVLFHGMHTLTWCGAPRN